MFKAAVGEAIRVSFAKQGEFFVLTCAVAIEDTVPSKRCGEPRKLKIAE